MSRSRHAVKVPPRIVGQDAARAVDALRDAMVRLIGIPLLDHEQIDGVYLDDEVTTAVPHSLGRPWKGWIIVDEVGGLDPGRVRRIPGGNDAKEIILRAYGFGEALTVSLLVW